MCFCFPQDAAGEDLRGAAVFFCDSVWAGGHTAVSSVQSSDYSDHQLQNRGEAYTGEVDTPCFAGNKSPELGIPMVAWEKTALLNMPFCHKGCESRLVSFLSQIHYLSVFYSLSKFVFDSLYIFFSSSLQASGNYTGKHLLWHSCWGQGCTYYIRHTYTYFTKINPVP